ncbi:hypothetical protein ANMWB30_37550 [Arthrobacter sp. MWB30]|nr:hypothetical protein ANMWB30_37550 [Arthrobacter sp. MWB30]
MGFIGVMGMKSDAKPHTTLTGLTVDAVHSHDHCWLRPAQT